LYEVSFQEVRIDSSNALVMRQPVAAKEVIVEGKEMKFQAEQPTVGDCCRCIEILSGESIQDDSNDVVMSCEVVQHLHSMPPTTTTRVQRGKNGEERKTSGPIA
jgi:hypothetical protein